MSSNLQPPLTLHSEILDYNADCAEFCPQPGLTHLLALGTYQLVEETQTRVGRAYLRVLQQSPSAAGDAAAAGPASGEGAERLDSIPAGSLDLPGIFDLKWRPGVLPCGGGGGGDRGQEGAVLGAALADGTLRLLEAVHPEEAERSGEEARSWRLKQQSAVAACSSGMCLSLDWHVATGSGEARVATSSSSGALALVQVTNSGLSVLSEWEAHSLEVWCTAFHKEGSVLFSGADDCYFKLYDIRSDPASLVFSDSRTHTAGVCTVSPHPTQHHIVATGSYDEHVRLWDTRNLSRPVVISQLNTGGGNWRLRWHPHDHQLLLAACMYNGFGVLRAGDDFRDLSLVCMYQSPNTHIAYGADWWQQQPKAAAVGSGAQAAPVAADPGAEEGGGRGRCALAATCSFYDKQHTLVWLGTGGP